MILNTVLVLILGVLAMPVMWFAIQVGCACWPARRQNPCVEDLASARIAVLIPAHNESVNLIPTLHAVQAEGLRGLRVVVVADNCTDDTAEIARQEGAEVVERTNPELRGKGYALDFGVQHLAKQPPEVVIILDADCLLDTGALKKLSDAALRTLRPVQALYLMKNRVNVSVKSRIAEFAWLVKNRVRPRGLHRLGLPCQLTGSGMAFPWPVLKAVPLATGEIVEDMKLGISLAAIGHPPLFLEDAVVHSVFPTHEEGVRSQRTRWEHGHLAMLFKEGLPKAASAMLKRDAALFSLALDLCIPPLALLVISLAMLQLCGTLLWMVAGNSLAFVLASLWLVITMTAVTAAWFCFGKSVVSGKDLLMTPLYMVSKLSVYIGFVFRRQAQWVRSRRDHESK